jgi:hypothetical protein
MRSASMAISLLGRPHVHGFKVRRARRVQWRAFPLLLDGLVLNVVLCCVLECCLRLDYFSRVLDCLLYDIAWNVFFMK